MCELQKKYNVDIIYEDNHLLVLNKKPSQIVQGDKTGDIPLTELLKSYLKEKYNKLGNVYLGLVHRLDRPTSGLVVFAKTDKAGRRLSKLFQERDLTKKYWAIVQNPPPESQGLIINFLKKNEKQNKSYVVGTDTSGAKKAELKYTYVGKSDRYHLLEIELLTGRHHQIRCQLAYIGCAIKGDVKYGFDRANKDLSIHLHARYIKFIHPVKKEPLKLKANPPQDTVWNYFVEMFNDTP
ncbi:MAG: RluA family pseudouridine synthase [Bacteroidales bacterium]|jgi:23S rRNA pseudouridine1911/1915/1917 synthase|nr:RluA family pseudouridine synthase [Bacteroidales bacterium]